MTIRSTRRRFIEASGASLVAPLCAAGFGGPLQARAKEDPGDKRPLGRAEHCVFVWLAGGACQLDTWDPKRRGDAKKRKAGSYYDSIPTAIEGVSVCEHLKRTARLLDRGTIVRTVHHDVIDEHAAATNRLHTGRPVSGTIIYPSIGSVVAHETAARVDGVPKYVVMGYPSASRGPGFLGSKHSYVYLTQTKAGPTGLRRREDITAARQRRRDELLGRLREDFAQRNTGDRRIRDYTDTAEQAERLAGPKFMSVFDLEQEKPALREQYGSEFGQRLLLARRLIERGTSFIEVTSNQNFKNGTGWDTHNQGQLKQHELIDDLDRGLSALLSDLERKKRLDKTLVVVATEFGRPAQFDGGGGRGHQSSAFSVAMFGGGLRGGRVVGRTDELSKKIVERPVSVPDLHATIYSALGINPAKELHAGNRPVPITDQGKPLGELLS